MKLVRLNRQVVSDVDQLARCSQMIIVQIRNLNGEWDLDSVNVAIIFIICLLRIKAKQERRIDDPAKQQAGVYGKEQVLQAAIECLRTQQPRLMLADQFFPQHGHGIGFSAELQCELRIIAIEEESDPRRRHRIASAGGHKPP